jgi:hypothetical protein
MFAMRALCMTVVVGLAWGCKEKPSEPVGTSALSTATPVQHDALPAALPSGVPALLPGESPPDKGPNYFDSHEISAGGVVHAFESCRSSAQSVDYKIPLEKVVPYCSCMVDAWRINLRSAGDPGAAARPDKVQSDRCAAAARSGSPSPFAFTFPKDTPSIYDAWRSCVDDYPDKDHGEYCACYVDAVFKDPKTLGLMVADRTRCELADRTWDATHKHLTPRQFAAIDVPDGGWVAEPPRKHTLRAHE